MIVPDTLTLKCSSRVLSILFTLVILTGCASDLTIPVNAYDSGIRQQVSALEQLESARSTVENIYYRQSLIDRASDYKEGVKFVPGEDLDLPISLTAKTEMPTPTIPKEKRNEARSLVPYSIADPMLLVNYAQNLASVNGSQTAETLNAAVSDVTLSTHVEIAAREQNPNNTLSQVDAISGLLSTVSTGYLRGKRNDLIHEMTSPEYLELAATSDDEVNRDCPSSASPKYTVVGCHGELMLQRSIENVKQISDQLAFVENRLLDQLNQLYKGQALDSAEIDRYTTLVVSATHARRNAHTLIEDLNNVEKYNFSINKATYCLNAISDSCADTATQSKNAKCIADFDLNSKRYYAEVLAIRNNIEAILDLSRESKKESLP